MNGAQDVKFHLLRTLIEGLSFSRNNDNPVLREILRRTEESASFFLGRKKCPVAMVVGETISKLGRTLSDVRPLF